MKKPDTGFHDFVIGDLLGELPGIRSRRMFGGWGMYSGDTFFAIITNGTLYLKANAEVAREFKKQGSRQFVYTKPKEKKRVTLSSYWSVPEDVLEDQEEFLRWVNNSIRALEF